MSASNPGYTIHVMANMWFVVPTAEGREYLGDVPTVVSDTYDNLLWTTFMTWCGDMVSGTVEGINYSTDTLRGSGR